MTRINFSAILFALTASLANANANPTAAAALDAREVTVTSTISTSGAVTCACPTAKVKTHVTTEDCTQICTNTSELPYTITHTPKSCKHTKTPSEEDAFANLDARKTTTVLTTLTTCSCPTVTTTTKTHTPSCRCPPPHLSLTTVTQHC